MVEFFLGMYGLIIFGVIILALGSWFIWDKRYKRVERPEIPEGFVRTNEIFIDPTTKKKMVVYFHPDTGERWYKEEDS